jgi:hypothetical protein
VTRPYRGFMSNEAIEELTDRRLREYERKVGKPVALPVPVEEVIEQALDLCILWDVVEERAGELIRVAGETGRRQHPRHSSTG